MVNPGDVTTSGSLEEVNGPLAMFRCYVGLKVFDPCYVLVHINEEIKNHKDT